jgi:hypothetical protein
MELYKKNSLEDFLANYPLNKEYKLIENYLRHEEGFTDPFAFIGETFTYYCEKEEGNRTFELELLPEAEEYFGKKSGGHVPEELINSDGRLDYAYHFKGICKSCKDYHIDLLLKIWSDIKIPKDYANKMGANSEGKYIHIDYLDKTSNIFIKKVGIFPVPAILADK